MHVLRFAAAPAATSVSQRVLGFDFLRGLCAIAVATYHVLSWQHLALLESWGRYGVYIFFVLSGASMYLAYERKFAAGYSAARFLALRFVRLAPLFLAALLLKFAYALLAGRPLGIELSKLYLNALFLFGMGNPAQTAQVIGGWSLGIEFLFYLIFPVLLALVRGRAWITLLVACFVAQHLFIGLTLDGRTLEAAWVGYTQLLSFIFYFAAGCAIGRHLQARPATGSPWAWAALAAILLPLASINGEDNLVGLTGMGLSLLACLVVLCAAALPLAGAMRPLADHLGKMSYGVYLLHPFVYMAASKLLPDSPALLGPLVVGTSCALALLAERYLEAPLMAWGQRKLASAPAA